jgi:hypothetical protein
MTTETTTMKMARASEADLDAALDVVRMLDDLARGNMPASDADDDWDWFDRDDDKQCGVVLGRILDAAEKGSLFRVVFGMSCVLSAKNELLDPDADTLEKHPNIIAALKTRERLLSLARAGYVVDAYALENGAMVQTTIQRARQIGGGDLWKVIRGSECLNHAGEWEYEPLPSSRDEEYLARCRFATADEAIAAVTAAQAA